MRTVTIASILTLMLLAAPMAQSPADSGTVDVSAADVRAMIALGENNPLRSIDAGQHVVFVWYEVRRPRAADSHVTAGIMHSQLTEIYYIVEGSATIRTGGRLTSERKSEIDTVLPGTTNVPRFASPTFSGRPTGGVSRRVSVGDIIVMPPGTVHLWESVDSPCVAYLIFRIDPEHTLYPGYTHPALRE